MRACNYHSPEAVVIYRDEENGCPCCERENDLMKAAETLRDQMYRLEKRLEALQQGKP